MITIEYKENLDKTIYKIIDSEFNKYAINNNIICNYNSFNFIAKDNNKIVGIITGHSYYKEVYISDLIILKNYRNKKIGTKLVKKVEEYFKDKEFEKHLVENAKILDLGAGSGRTYSYFNERGYEYIGLDFSKGMKECAYRIHGKFSYIVDDMINIKKHFSNESLDAIFAVYSLFHLPTEDLKKLFSDIYDILKVNGIFLFSYQIG